MQALTGHDQGQDQAEGGRRANQRLPPEVTRFLYVKNLPFKITGDQLYEIFAKFGSIRQVRRGVSQTTRGTAFVVYDNIYDAKLAVEKLSGFNVGGRYLIVLYYRKERMTMRPDLAKRRAQLNLLKRKYGVKDTPVRED
eukprot:71683_1